MKYSAVFLMTVALYGCQTGAISDKSVSGNLVKTPDGCCAHWSADGSCVHELIAGCSTNGLLHTMTPTTNQQEPTMMTPMGTSDACCAHRTADGNCAHELIPGCSGN